jgi:ribosomal protein S18 acetylase RimI-like enzyme
MNSITIRRITPQDLPALSAISKKTFYDTFTGTCTEEDMQGFLVQYYDEAVLAKDLESGMEFYFAEVNGEPAGYLSFKDEAPGFSEIKGSSALELKRFYVLEEYHGKGLAHTMINFVIDHAIAQGYDDVFLGVWEYNFRAQKFYEKHGFKLTEHRHPFPIGNTPQTDVYMVKYLEMTKDE